MRSTQGQILIITFILILVQMVSSERNQKRTPSGSIGENAISEIPKTSLPLSEQLPAAGSIIIKKRAPSMGFIGMRGKKPWEAYERNLVYNGDKSKMMLKRVPSGFFGMRGKRNDDYEDSPFDMEKRVKSGFFGMRGKKDDPISDNTAVPIDFWNLNDLKTDYDSFGDLEKRAPSGFFGMRGKKQWFSLRGKKMPYQFKGKFVGVRGKKNENDNFQTENRDDNSDMGRLLKQLMENDIQERHFGADQA